MTPENAWIYAILPFLSMAVLTVGFVVVFRQRAKTRRALDVERPSRVRATPWWRLPITWIAIVVVAIALAVAVWPGAGLLVLLVPLLAFRGRVRRRPPVDPRSNGHAHRDGGTFSAD